MIVALAQLMQQDVRPDAALCRSGGEEFLLLLPNVTLAQAALIAERLRLKVASHEMATAGRITISLGVAHWPGHEQSALATVLKQADESLYEAKRQGRNRVVVTEAD
ncbi:putative diguanylate cyclase YdaM [compost metagenome]